MKVNITASDLVSATGLTEKAVAKLFSQIEFDSSDFSHDEIQYCIDNEIEFSGCHLYSPVLTQSQMNQDVPTAWPGSMTGEEGEERVKTFFEYAQWHAVTGGYSIKFSAGAASANKNISLPNFTQLKVWEAKVNGFLTKAEFDAIKTVEE